MSGSGAFLPGYLAAFVTPRSADPIADVIAYLEQRRDNAATMAARKPEFCDWAHDRRSQLDAMIEDLRAGLYIGKAEVRAALLTKQAELSAEGLA